MEGELQIRLSPDARSYELIPRTVHRTVASESPAELKAARLVPRWDIAHVVCARKAVRRFTCDGIWKEPGYRTGIEFGLEIRKEGRYFLVPCRITWLGQEWGAFLACQHLAWNVNFPEGELEGMEVEEKRNADPIASVHVAPAPHGSRPAGAAAILENRVLAGSSSKGQEAVA